MFTLSLYWRTLLSSWLEIFEMVGYYVLQISVSVELSSLELLSLEETVYFCFVVYSLAPEEETNVPLPRLDTVHALLVGAPEEIDGRLLDNKLKEPIFLIKFTISPWSI